MSAGKVTLNGEFNIEGVQGGCVWSWFWPLSDTGRKGTNNDGGNAEGLPVYARDAGPVLIALSSILSVKEFEGTWAEDNRWRRWFSEVTLLSGAKYHLAPSADQVINRQRFSDAPGPRPSGPSGADAFVSAGDIP